MWQVWGIEQAINSGDTMFAIAHLALNRLIEQDVPAPVVVTALRRFDETCVGLTQGQHADMDFETRDDVSVAEYMEMITGKTAVLISLSAELGALVAGASTTTVHHYAQFGLDLGLAFQVIDDILGIWGDEAVIGKSASTDILTKKKTLPVLYGLEQSQDLNSLCHCPGR
ncbi:MAG: polyprenyl synthetase family protein [Chloroflexi bacterium]|nr:polyprenyl synthetase family protein [Chloroflexota bacterium]